MPSFSDKGAERFLEWWWQRSKEEQKKFALSWEKFTHFSQCNKCSYFAEESLCEFCSNPKRNKKNICVVVSPFTAYLIDKETDYQGLFFVLNRELGRAKRSNNLEYFQKKAVFLKERINKENIEEIILATDFTSSGEATALFLRENLEDIPSKITRLAQGFHIGDSLTYSDPTTLKVAFERRNILNK